MSKVADSIRRGLEQAVADAKGEADLRAYRVHVPKRIDVRAIRTRLGMTQEEFAGRFGFSVNTLRHWEQGKRQPEGATRAYLLVIDRAPRAVQKALRAAQALRRLEIRVDYDPISLPVAQATSEAKRASRGRRASRSGVSPAPLGIKQGRLWIAPNERVR